MKDILYGLGAMLLLALMVIWGLALALAGPALLKFCILYLGIVRIVIPLMTSLPAAKAEKLSAMFSVTQLFTALIGGVIAMLLVEPIRTAIAKNRS